MKQGLIQIYTGEGKGKTTAAVGLALRSRGHNLKVGYIFFFKDPKRFGYAELKLLKKLGVRVAGFSHKHPHFYMVQESIKHFPIPLRKSPRVIAKGNFLENINEQKVRKECLKGLEFIKKVFRENKYDILILDEILISLRDGFLKEEEVLKILDSKPKHLELVLTGRCASKKIIEKADLVSEIKKIKHPYDLGIKGRKGIEY